MKTRTKLKSQKPIELDIYLRYMCPKPDCGYDHWLSLKEAQINNTKIVCDCGHVFRIKKIHSVNVKYSKQLKTKIEAPIAEEIPLDIEKKAVKLLASYGFAADESLILVKKGFKKHSTDSAVSLVRYIIKNLGELDEQSK